ncbi:hypothetical protein [Mycolicibacterium sp.]|uniref:hypothetical protein n=1 Tax=Mycolicibacterium sp. TaxID=2320850 RepID=UPI0028B06EE5|nr:hypothetical protein [Mycolicibacterium sp.]
MGEEGLRIVLLDSLTAATLAGILPVLLLTLAGELRRTRYMRDKPRLLGLFFIVFGTIETMLVFSIDGAFYPFQWFDSFVGIIIFGLLFMLFRLSLADSREHEFGHGHGHGHDSYI